MKAILKEPLVHFLLIGAALFAIFSWSGDQPAASTEKIVVSTGRIEQLVRIFQKTWQRPPTADELKGLIDDFVLEEAYYRQAVAMGIDRDDTIIRRRMRQKLEFLTDDVTTQTPTDEDLSTYLAQNQDKFRESPAYTFRQVYFNPGKHRDDGADFFEKQIDSLKSGDDQIGDPTLIPGFFEQVTRRQVDGTFGSGFSATLDELELGDWQGPVQSGLGLHLILLEDKTEGRLPELDEIRPIVEREWSNEQRLANRDTMNRELLQQYDVVIEWPQESSDQVAERQTDAPSSGGSDG